MSKAAALKVELQKSLREEISTLDMHHDPNYIIATICSMELIVQHYKKQLLLEYFPKRLPKPTPSKPV